MRKLLVTAAVVGLAACSTTTEPVAFGDGSFLIATNARGGANSNSQLKAQTIQAAQAFCAKDGKKAVVQDASARGAQGWTPQDVEVRFRCE